MGQFGAPCPKPSFTRDKQQAKRERDRHWQDVRRQVLERDGRRCRVCHVKQGTDVHHIRFRSVGGDNTTANLACLCAVCHSAVHSYRLAITGDANKRLSISWI